MRLNALPHNLKEIPLLRALGQLSNEEAAAALGVSKQAVRTRIHRARKVLRQSMAGYVAYEQTPSQ